MIRTVRAAGFAVAAFVIAASAAWSGPLQAVQGDAAPTVHYLSHADASAEISDIGVNDGGSNAAPATPARVEAPAATTVASATEAEHLGAFADQMIALADAVLPHPRSLGELVNAYAGLSTDDRQQDCLANAVYFEARGEPIEGQLAVAEVVLNRTRSGKYPAGICDVVVQPWQFSFIRKGRFPQADRSSDSWRKAVAISRIALDKLSAQVPQDVLWYHATYVSPSWGKRLKRETQIGLHIFYS